MIIDTDWDSLVWAATDRRRAARIAAAWNEHLPDPYLPRLAAPASAAGQRTGRPDQHGVRRHDLQLQHRPAHRRIRARARRRLRRRGNRMARTTSQSCSTKGGTSSASIDTSSPLQANRAAARPPPPVSDDRLPRLAIIPYARRGTALPRSARPAVVTSMRTASERSSHPRFFPGQRSVTRQNGAERLGPDRARNPAFVPLPSRRVALSCSSVGLPRRRPRVRVPSLEGVTQGCPEHQHCAESLGARRSRPRPRRSAAGTRAGTTPIRAPVLPR